MNQKGPGLALSRNSDGSRAANAEGAPRKHAAFHSSQPRARKAPPHVILRGGATGSNARPMRGSARPDDKLRAVSKDLAPIGNTADARLRPRGVMRPSCA